MGNSGAATAKAGPGASSRIGARRSKWQRLPPFERFAAMIERHWQGIAAYCQPENKVALGFVEGLNNKIALLGRWPPQEPLPQRRSQGALSPL